MALPVQEQLKYWGIATAVFLAVLWFLGDVLFPFLLAGAFAYILDPVADRLERRGLPRWGAVTVISAVALLIFVAMALLVVPLLVEQAVALFDAAPSLFSDLQSFLTERFPSIVDSDSALRRSLVSLGETIQSRGAELVQRLLSSVSGLVNVALWLVIVPVATFYLLLDWDNMVGRIDELLPRDHAPTIRRLAGQIDTTLAAFIRGQGLVCVIMGIYYSVALMLVGLQFGLVVGFVAGLITFIPYVGAIVGGVLSIGLALFQFWGEWWMILIVIAIFQAGQLVEGNVITPNLVGSSVGLHPVWLILALTVFGSVFGFVGLLVAVPVAAAMGVLIRFAVAEYKSGRLYRGLEADEDESEDR